MGNEGESGKHKDPIGPGTPYDEHMNQYFKLLDLDRPEEALKVLAKALALAGIGGAIVRGGGMFD